MISVIDTETTGLDPATDRVVEVAAVPLVNVGYIPNSGGRIMVSIEPGVSSLVYPGRDIPPQASAIHHIIDEDVEDSPPLGRAVDHVLGPMWRSAPDPLFVAHNAKFDRSFLPMLKDFRWVDTYRCALHIWPDAPGHGNQTLRYWLKLGAPRDLPTHRALGDAVVTAHIFKRLLAERGVDELEKLSRKAVVLKICRFKKHRGKPWVEVPTDYLKWVVREIDDDPDALFTAKTEIARREGRLTEQGNQP